jgi:hypothetical protein
VTACFPAGTPVAVEGGYKNIEELQVGELVWAWHEETGDLALKPVLQTMQREADALVELQVGADMVQATPEHPFWANGAWTDAGNLVKGDELLRSDGLTMPVGQVTHRTEQATTVYNVEVADWHTYLVSWWMFVVHNICDNNIIKLITRNAKLAGKKHAKTSVEFVEKTIEYGGKKITGVFPKFDSAFKLKLPKRLHQASDYDQFTSSTKFLREQIKKTPELGKNLLLTSYLTLLKGKIK